MTCLAGLAFADTNITDGAVAASPPQLPFEIPKLSEDDAGAAQSPLMAASGLPGAATAMHPAPAGGVRLEDIRDIRGPIPIPLSLPWVWIAIAALSASGVIALAWRRYRRRFLVRAERAYEIAFEQLELARTLMQPEQAREFSFLVSETVRTYIDKRFDLGVIHSTTEEFIRSLIQDPANPLTEHTESLRDFLGHCDFAKFARWTLSAEQMQAMHASAWRLVEETRRHPEDQSKTNRRAAKLKQEDVAPSIPVLAAGGAS